MTGQEQPASLNHGFDAYQDDGRRGWIGQFWAPGIGVCRVKDGAGLVRLHGTEIEARLAASDALCAALDRGRNKTPSLTAKVFRRFGSGKGRVLLQR